MSTNAHVPSRRRRFPSEIRIRAWTRTARAAELLGSLLLALLEVARIEWLEQGLAEEGCICVNVVSRRRGNGRWLLLVSLKAASPLELILIL